MKRPTMRGSLGTFGNSAVTAAGQLAGGCCLIKLVQRLRMWETSAVQRGQKLSSYPSAKLFITSPSEEVWEKCLLSYIILSLSSSLSLSLSPSPSFLIHISWRALEVWNCLKLIHYWIFSCRLKSLASLPHNSAPIDCLGPNISQGCTERFSVQDFLHLYPAAPGRP